MRLGCEAAMNGLASSDTGVTSAALVDDLFRREAGKISAWLARVLGPGPHRRQMGWSRCVC